MEQIVDQSKCLGGGNPANFSTGHTGIAFNQGFNLSEVGHGSTNMYVTVHYTPLYVYDRMYIYIYVYMYIHIMCRCTNLVKIED